MLKNIKVLLVLFIIIIFIGGLSIKEYKKRSSIVVNNSIDFIYEIQNKTIITEVNSNINLFDNVSCNNDIDVNIQGTYDFSKENIYNLNYILSTEKEAIKEPFTLVVASNIQKTKNNFNIYTVNDITYVDNTLIVNKSFPLPSNYYPINRNSVTCVDCLDSIVMEEFFKMQADAFINNLNLYISSGFRSYERQQELYTMYTLKDGQDKAEIYSARPGHSEHQTGLAFDLNSIDSTFADTDEGRWVNENCYKYGFIIRYPKNKDTITGYKYEPWHLRYVGQDLAKIIYNNGNWLTLEEYYGIPSSYK